MAKKPLITKIHGRYYDVGELAHPGGCAAIECARDRDATPLFESYHALHRDLPLKSLEKFEIPAERAEAEGRFLAEKRFGPSPYDWEETLASPFRAALLEYAHRYFEEERARRKLPGVRAAVKAPPARWLETGVFGALFFASLVPFVGGSWIALFLMPVLGWIFMVNFWHDALHFAMSRNWRVNALIPYVFPWFLSPKLWMHQHVIAHHAFTNDPLRDPDIRVAPQLLRQSLGISWCPVHAKQHRVLRLLIFYSLPSLVRVLVRDHLTRIRGWFNDAVPLVMGSAWRRALHIFGRVAIAASLVVWPFFVFPAWKAIFFATIPSLVLSELFVLFSQVNHVTEPNSRAGLSPPKDWYEAQVRTSCSYAMDSYWAYLISGGLNLQIEHHLFPGVNHHHLFRMSPQIRRICEEHGVPYHSYPTFSAAIAAHFAWIRALSREHQEPA